MGSDTIQNGSASNRNVNSAEPEEESNDFDSLEVVSSGGDITRDMESASESLTRAELDLACSAEKLVNLEILVMHVASRENDFEAFSLEEKVTLEGSVAKALEFDILYGFLDSEIREQESILSASGDTISSFKHLVDSSKELQEKLQDCDESLKRSLEQLDGIKMQSDNFKRILLSSSGDENWKGDKDLTGVEDHDAEDINAKIKMQTAEQQRNVLRMLEKSLAREMDLEKKLAESRQTEEDLKLRLQQEILSIEEESEDIWERLFEAENSAEIFSAISKELLGRIQDAQDNLNESVKREKELLSRLEDLNGQMKEKDSALLNSERSKTELVEKVNLQLGELERVEQLEKHLKDSENKRERAEASVEAIEEKQAQLDTTIMDMENLIKNLKLKVSKAENQTDAVEEKCIILSEANQELVEETSFLKEKVKSLEASVRQAAEAKKATAKDIKIRTGSIADLILQLALERERLHKQISTLNKEKKVMAVHLQQIKKEQSVAVVRSLHPEVNSVKRDLSSSNEITMVHADSASNLNTIRNIDARQLNRKYILLAVTVLLIPVLSALWFQQ